MQPQKSDSTSGWAFFVEDRSVCRVCRPDHAKLFGCRRSGSSKNRFLSFIVVLNFSSFTLLPVSTFSLAQDPCFYVRQDFITKLCDYLNHSKLPPSFTVMLFLAAHDEPEIRLIVRLPLIFFVVSMILKKLVALSFRPKALFRTACAHRLSRLNVR